MPFKVIGKLAQYPCRLRITDLRGEATALLLNFQHGFRLFQHGGTNLDQPASRGYGSPIARPDFLQLHDCPARTPAG